MQLNRSIQYNDKSNSNTTQQSVTEITNACQQTESSKFLDAYTQLGVRFSDRVMVSITVSQLSLSWSLTNKLAKYNRESLPNQYSAL